MAACLLLEYGVAAAAAALLLAPPLRLVRNAISDATLYASAKERNDELVEAWLKHDWPRIKRGLEEAGGRLPSWTRRVVRFGPA